MEATINGIRTHYIDEGRPGAPPVVLVHGLAMDRRMWDPQIELLRAGYRVVAYDFRGHGRSGAGDGQFTYRQLVDDLAALLDHLNIDRPVICGLSMGGAISLRTIEMYPERVHALVLCDTTCNPDTNEAKHWREKSIQSIKRDGLGPFVEDFLEVIFSPRTFEVHPETVERIRRFILSSSPLGICGALLAQAARTDTCPTLPHIGVPTLIMVGSEDALTPVAGSRAMHEMIPGSELRVIPDAGHMSNLENTQEFNNHLLRFLETLR